MNISAMLRGMKTDLAEQVAARLRLAMRDMRICNSSALASALGFEKRNWSTVRNWTNGTQTPPVEQAIRLSRMLDVTLDWLYTGDTAGLTEGKRIRLAALAEGLEPPVWAQEQESAPEPAKKLAKVGRRRAKGRATVS